jgi:D-alanine-D-alanine ligase
LKVVVLHNEPGEDASLDQQDVLAQRDAVSTALQQLGHQTHDVACTLDLGAARERLIQLGGDVVFNLVESLGGTDRLMPLATLLLDALAIPYTGAGTAAMLTSSNKLAAKERLQRAGLPTSPISSISSISSISPISSISSILPGHPPARPGNAMADSRGGDWIIKPVWEHASFGMDDSAVVRADDHASLERLVQARQQRTGRPHFAELYIDGREFNLSLLDGEVLPPAEIDFSSFPSGKPRIVGEQAKWDQDSFEYHQTPRRFDFPASDGPLLERLRLLARRCWALFDLGGYARVDFRVDRGGRPWILEINANPCLSPDAGFAAALIEAGIEYPDAIRRIIDAASVHKGEHAATS